MMPLGSQLVTDDTKVEGLGRVPHIRPSVCGPKTMGEADNRFHCISNEILC